MSDYKQYVPGGLGDEPLLTMEERAALDREKTIEKNRFEFHADMSFDKALEKLEEFDSYEPFVPAEVRQYGDRRMAFRVYERHFIRSDGYASLSVFLEESERFGVDIIAVASGAGSGIHNFKSGTNEVFVNEFKKHMGVEVPKESFMKKARRYLFE